MTLDADGKANVSLQVTPEGALSLSGRTVFHAFVVVEEGAEGGRTLSASNAVPLHFGMGTE